MQKKISTILRLLLLVALTPTFAAVIQKRQGWSDWSLFRSKRPNYDVLESSGGQASSQPDDTVIIRSDQDISKRENSGKFEISQMLEIGGKSVITYRLRNNGYASVTIKPDPRLRLFGQTSGRDRAPNVELTRGIYDVTVEYSTPQKPLDLTFQLDSSVWSEGPEQLGENSELDPSREWAQGRAYGWQ